MFRLAFRDRRRKEGSRRGREREREYYAKTVVVIACAPVLALAVLRRARFLSRCVRDSAITQIRFARASSRLRARDSFAGGFPPSFVDAIAQPVFAISLAWVVRSRVFLARRSEERGVVGRRYAFASSRGSCAREPLRRSARETGGG